MSSEEDTKQVWSFWERTLFRGLTSNEDESESHDQLYNLRVIVAVVVIHQLNIRTCTAQIPYSGKIWRTLNLAKWQKKGCILILAKFKFGDLELYL